MMHGAGLRARAYGEARGAHLAAPDTRMRVRVARKQACALQHAAHLSAARAPPAMCHVSARPPDVHTWTSRRTSSTSVGVASFRLAMDLHAYLFPVAFSATSRVVPNWPFPSTLPKA